MDDLQAALLAASSSDDAEVDERDYLIISNDFRTISIPRIKSVLGVYNDSNVNRVWFKGPRYYGDVDLSTYDFKINFINAEEDGDVYIVDDLTIDGDNIIFSWLVGSSAFVVEGNVVFNVCAKILNSGATEVTNEFNTTIHTLPVLKGLEIDNEYIRTHYPTFIDQIEALVNQTTNMASGASASKDSAANSAAEALSSKIIAANSASSAMNSKNTAANNALLAKQRAESLDRDAIIKQISNIFPAGTASGSIVSFSDGANDLPIKAGTIHVEPVQDLHGYDSPWPAGGGANILPPQNITGSISNVAVSSDGDVVTLNGTASAYGQVISSSSFVLDAGNYYLKIFVVSGSVSGGHVQYQLRSEDGLTIYVMTRDGTAFTLSEQTVVKARVTYVSGVSISDYKIRAMVVRGSTATTTFSPYSNICPISGWTQANVLASYKGDVWHRLKAAVDTGKASSFYKVGSQITDTWYKNNDTSFDAPWDVVHIDSNGEVELKWHYSTPDGLPFDAPEAIYYAGVNGLAAGTYHIPIGSAYGQGWKVGDAIQFTLTAAMDAGDQLYINFDTNYDNDPTAGRAWNVYAKGSTTSKQNGTTSKGTEGTSLGTIGATSAQKPEGQLNAIARAVYGYGRWSQSAMRQWLNSEAAAGAWWTPQNDWDRPPAEAATLRGFLAGCTADFLSILEPVEVVTALNTVEGYDTDRETTIDRIFLPSLEQMYIDPQLSGAEGEYWDYYKELAEEAGISGKFRMGSAYPILITYRVDAHSYAVRIRFRSANRGNTFAAWNMYTSGSANSNAAYYANRGCPACKIKKSSQTDSRAYTVDLNGTVYGATYDPVAKRLTVDRVEADAGAASWVRYDGSNGYAFYTGLPLMRRGVSGAAPDFIMSNYKSVSTTSRSAFVNQGAENTVCHVNDGRGIYVKDSRYTDAAAFKTSMAGQQIVYELESPVIYENVEIDDITTYLGNNTFWADCGDIDLTYCVDPTKYIEKRLAELNNN